MKIVDAPHGAITFPRGFKTGAVYCGIKTSALDKRDLGVIISDTVCAAAAVFTKNLVKAAPLRLSKAHLVATGGTARAVVVNSGNANAVTGTQGDADAAEMAQLIAERFSLSPQDVLVASTGVIGVLMPMEKVRRGVAEIEVGEEWGNEMARAIMTTDTRPKQVAVECQIGGTTVRLGGIAKGSGMIHPNMGTMLAFVTTDAAVDSDFLREALQRVCDRTFNMITVDGDTSTNDTLAVLANGVADNDLIMDGTADATIFEDALGEICLFLAKEIARDGEGATRLIESRVAGALTVADARLAARAIVASSLFKAAVYGKDPNWGRILCAIGYSGAQIVPELIDLTVQNIRLLTAGQPIPFDKKKAADALDTDTVIIEVHLHQGSAGATAWGCDLTEQYVVINSEYTT